MNQDDINQHLQVLGLPSNSSYEEVKIAYKELVQIYHPDRFHGKTSLQNRAEKRLQAINNSYSTLKSYYTSHISPPPPPASQPSPASEDNTSQKEPSQSGPSTSQRAPSQNTRQGNLEVKMKQSTSLSSWLTVLFIPIAMLLSRLFLNWESVIDALSRPGEIIILVIFALAFVYLFLYLLLAFQKYQFKKKGIELRKNGDTIITLSEVGIKFNCGGFTGYISKSEKPNNDVVNQNDLCMLNKLGWIPWQEITFIQFLYKRVSSIFNAPELLMFRVEMKNSRYAEIAIYNSGIYMLDMSIDELCQAITEFSKGRFKF